MKTLLQKDSSSEEMGLYTTILSA